MVGLQVEAGVACLAESRFEFIIGALLWVGIVG